MIPLVRGRDWLSSRGRDLTLPKGGHYSAADIGSATTTGVRPTKSAHSGAYTGPYTAWKHTNDHDYLPDEGSADEEQFHDALEVDYTYEEQDDDYDSDEPYGYEQPRLRLGSIAPNFQAETTTAGVIDFYNFIGDSWCILFSHPEDFTPVCTTELGQMAKMEEQFKQRNVKFLGLSADDIKRHHEWIKDIDEVTGSRVQFPIVADKSRQVSLLYDMIDHQDATNVDKQGMAMTIRSVFIIDPKKIIRTILSYPASTGRNSAEILRIVDSLQAGDKYNVTTPIDWQPGQDVIVHPSLNNEQAKEKFPDVRAVKPYLRFTPLPKNDM